MHRRRRLMLVLLFVGLCVGASYFGPPYLDEMRLARVEASENIIEGRARVIDGDTLEVANRRVRLNGIDACEMAQSAGNAAGETYDCGVLARSTLVDLIGTRRIRCLLSGRDRYGCDIGRCFVGTSDLSEELISAGAVLAKSYGAHLRLARYALLELHARSKRRGIWAGAFENPAEWRAKNR